MLGEFENQFSLTRAALSMRGAQKSDFLSVLLISLCMSGNTDFWHNDLFTGIGHPFPGNNLFGAERW